jgi:hypothetical protein
MPTDAVFAALQVAPRLEGAVHRGTRRNHRHEGCHALGFLRARPIRCGVPSALRATPLGDPQQTTAAKGHPDPWPLDRS